MEAAVSCSMGAMGPVLRKLDLLLASESRLRKRVKDGIGLLKQDLEEVGSALVDLSMLETPSLRAKCWMEEARELSYHIEDFVDDLTPIRRDAGAKIRSVSSHRVGRVKIALLPAPPRRSTRVAKVAQLRDLLWQASERLERYQLDACCSSRNHMNMITQHRWAPALYGDAASLVGIEDSRTKLTKMLTGEAEQQLKVVSIVGPAGVGKTTLAKEIFRELRGLFDLRAFVHASRKLDMRRLLGSILSQVQPRHQLRSVAGSVQSLIDIIQEQLQDKRYLIVIDDLWEETAWDIVRGAFPEGNNCSRIVATTENMNVALKCCSYMAHNILKMKPLGIQDSGYLFFNRVFGSEQQCPDELKEVSYGIIRKCCGLPLSLILVAGLLSSIDYSELWYHVHDRLCSILNRSHTIEEIQKTILNLSYNSLPQCLKTCLLYFNMYPEGYIMWKVHLVKQWIAEGFINAAEGKDTEEIAEGYFEELVNRGMVQPMRIDYNDEGLSCTVHHIIFDLINHNSKEEEFIAAIAYSQPITGLSTKAHRLSFQLSSAKYAKQPARITMSQLRSLGFFGFIKCMPPIVEFKHLRVLVLDFWGSHDGHMSLNLSRICILFQLRYLKISGDIMVELPAQMKGLHYLETLEIDARLSAVPLDIVHLPSLLHLGLRAATKLPDGIGHIKSLSTLLYFDLRCNSEDNIWSLGQLTNLRHLHLTCSAVLSSDHLKRKLIPLAFSLGKLGNLKSLTLTPDALRSAILFDISSGISSPSIFLQRLELLPPICFFSRLPTWFGELHKLCILKIVVKELHGNDISNISGLPSLTVFSLYVRRALTGTVVFSTMAFRALKYFKFTCGVMCLAFQAGAMPNLQRVKLCFNAHRGQNHNRVLDGIEHLLNLQEVVGRIGVLPGADESDWRLVKLSFEDIIRKHPRCPRFNSQPVYFIEEEYPPSDKFHLRQHEGSSSEHEIVEKACAKDMDKHIDSRLSREYDLPPSSGTSYHHKSDEYSEHHMLVCILWDESAEPTTLGLSLLEDITNNFSTEQEVDQGGFGMVYKGILGDGIIAVKRLCGPHETVDLAYIFHCLMRVKHSNIVRFLGYWEPQPNAIKKWGSDMGIEQQDMLLCFEYLHNGSLRRHITEESCGFEWHTCYQIIKGICQGLDYLHKNSIIHLHLKPENILLDANMVPKIADYAYARLLGEDRPTATQEIVTLLAPEYHEDGAISLKSDIYSLGVIITQMVAGHKDHSNIKSVLGGWRSRLESDTSWRHTELETAYRQVILCIEMGKSCMHRDPSKRPCIRDIIDKFAEMETSEASVTSGTSFVSMFKCFSLPFSPKKLFRRSSEESEASLITPSPTSGQLTDEKKVVIKVGFQGDRARSKTMAIAASCEGVFSKSSGKDGSRLSGCSSRASSASMPPSAKTECEILQSANVKVFTFNNLKAATRNFRPDSVLGEGGFGSVYKGWIDENTLSPCRPGTGIAVAVKKLNHEGLQGHREWLAEVNYLGQFCHPNLVKLIGYCVEDEHRLLVYEFMPRGSLENHLFRRGSYFQPLSWNLRMKVALGAAKGLAYLHSAEAKVIYRDFKTSNILLDTDYSAKLSDFGLAKDGPVGEKSHVSTRVMGTYGYAAPEYLSTGHLTTKSDIYSFGVVLLEMLSGRRAIDKNRPQGEHNLVEWARPYLTHKRKIFRILDTRLEGQYNLNSAQTIAALALECLSYEAKMRPTMDAVVTILQEIQDSGEAEKHQEPKAGTKQAPAAVSASMSNRKPRRRSLAGTKETVGPNPKPLAHSR